MFKIKEKMTPEKLEETIQLAKQNNIGLIRF